MTRLTRSAGIDDAYISYRYAENFADGRGLVFNAGEKVEGISNLFWTLLLSACSRVGVPLPTAGKLLGFAALVLLVVLVRRLALAVGLPPVAAVAVAAGTAVTSDLVASSTIGLEGGLYAALLVAGLLTWTGAGRWELLFALTVAGLVATRPEGLIVGLMLAATRTLGPGVGWGRLRAAVGALAAIGGVEFARWAYYGSPVPNSVTAKRDIGVSPATSLRNHARAGLHYLWDNAGLVVLAAAAICLVATVLLARRSHRPTAPAVLLPAVLTVAAGFTLPILSGGDWMPNGRLLAPYLPIGYVLVTWLVAASGLRRGAAVAVVVPLVLAAVGPHGLPLRDGRDALATDAGFDATGRALSQAGLGQRVVATDVLGRLGFYAPDVAMHDMFGLTEPDIARTPGSGSVYGKRNFAVTAAERPAVVASNSWRTVQIVAGTLPVTPYVAVIGDQLTGQHVFLLAAPDVAPRLAGLLHAQVAPAPQAIEGWRASYPAGQ